MKEWLRDTRVQIGGSIVMSLAAFACSPKDTQIRIVPATETPTVAAAPISAERTQTPTVVPTLAPDIPGIHDSKSDTPTPTPEPAATAKSTQGSDTPKPTATPAAERAPQPTATPRPTQTVEVPTFIEAFDRAESKQVGEIFNQLRVEAGLRPRDGISPQLQSTVDDYALLLSKKSLSGLTGEQLHFLDGDPQSRADRHGYHGLVTELIYNTPATVSAEDIVKAFLNSPPHRTAIYSQYQSTKDMAISIYKYKQGINLQIVVVNFGIPQ